MARACASDTIAFVPCSPGDPNTVPSPIAVDGTAGSGKSTLGTALARRYGFTLFDTGVTYRAFTLLALERRIPASDEDACVELVRSTAFRVGGQEETRIWIDGNEVTHRLREPLVEAAVSDYSAIAGVREVMVALQREIAMASPSVVVGRDIGTVVLPDAPVKLYLTASADERAKRRALQAGTWGQQQDAADASDDIKRRDSIDSTRGGLSQPPDATVIDTTDLTPEGVLVRAIEVIECAK